MNNKRLTCNVLHCILVSVGRFTGVLALLRNRCYSSTSRNKNAVFFAEIQIRCKFFGSSPRGQPLLPLWEIGSKKDS